jgi:hypothetical protein
MKPKLKLMLLILLLTMSLKGFSQNATDSTSIQLKKPIARLAIKDLIKGDGAKQELVLFKEKTSLLETKISLKDSIIFTLESKNKNFLLMLDTKDEQINVFKDINLKLKSDLKKSRFQTKLVGTIGIASFIGLIIILK